MKRLFILLLLLMPIAMAYEKYGSFDKTVNIEISDWLCNVTINDEEHSYSCNSSSTNSFDTTIDYNFTYECNQFENFSHSVTQLAETCKTIGDAYKDSSTYYDSYLTCNTEKETCKNQLQTCQTEKGDSTNLRIEKENCENSYTEIERQKNDLQLSKNKCDADLATAISKRDYYSSQRVIFLFIGMAIPVGFYFLYWKNKKSHKDSTDKELGSG